MRTTIKMLLDDSGLRDAMIQRGFERLSNFSWQGTVQKTVAVYEELV